MARQGSHLTAPELNLPHALLVVDMQQGAFDGQRCPPIDDAAGLLARTRQLLAAARASATPVVFIRHGAGSGTPFEDGTPGHRLHPALEAAAHERVVDKRACDAFDGTTLASTLAELGAERLLICGLQSDECVQATSHAALQQGHAVALADDAHGTWPIGGPNGGLSSAEIRAQINATLAEAGAELRPAAAWASELTGAVRFDIPGPGGTRLIVRDLLRHEVPRLQRLWDANPTYFQTVNGRNANPGEALDEFDERPPATLAWRQHWMLGLFDARGELIGTIVVVSDLVAAGAWHLTLFWLADAQHGSGLAQATYDALEAWVHGQGACWFRLACVVGNTRAERFWERQGFVELKRWKDFDTGGRKNAMRVMLKPLGGESIDAYLDAVPRDRPAAAG